MSGPEMTPMLRQYRELKQHHPDALLFYRLGDFYELFEEDARVAARALGLALTTRRFSKKVRLPMCGVPYRTVTSYVARLLRSGHKVALAEQMEDARRTRGLVRRDVVRIITPGTVVEEELLAQGEQSLLVAIVTGDVGSGRLVDWDVGAASSPATNPQSTNLPAFGLALVDLSTGEFAATQGAGWPVLGEELQRLRPREIVLPASHASDEAWAGALCAMVGGGPEAIRISSVPDVEAQFETARQRLSTHFRTEAIPGLDGAPLAVAAAGAALCYLQHNQVSDLAHLRSLEPYNLAHYVALDATTRRNLELTATLRDGRTEGSLAGVLDCTETAMGTRLLHRWIHQPLLDAAMIEARLDAVQELVSPPHLASAAAQATPFLRGDLRRALDGLHDVERLVGRVGFGSANARDLAALGRSLGRIPRIKALLAAATSARLRALDASLDSLSDVAGMIDAALVERPPVLIREGGLFRRGYDTDLDALRTSASAGRDWLAQFETSERERLDIPNLRVKYNQVFGFFIEVTRSHLAKIPPEYERRATVRGAERFVTPALQARESEILAAEDRADDLEYDLFVQLRSQVAGESARLLAAARVLAEVDVLTALAEVAARHSYTRPRVDSSDIVDIREGRHPVVERMLPAGEPFIANDTHLDHDERLLIITGPNMAGKSVLVRQVALILLMAQIGSFVPAASAHVGMADRIFARVGASDDIAHGRSTFLVEMAETAHILAHATRRSLVILDEVGRGTSTYDGMSLAWAVAADLHDRAGARCLFATHYHELTDLPGYLPAARNYHLAVAEREGDVIFLRRLVPGSTDRSYGLHVARLAGVPPEVVDHASRIMDHFKDGGQPETAQIGAVAAVHEPPARLSIPTGDGARAEEIVRELRALDIANLTPVQALVVLNEWQMRLRDTE
ncbi:MAG: DNA mismatch repair protein MutS [Anaerolineae bacterium]|nr:DNA mismatch repair protein MutS [Anaerolineae bacterium]